MNNKAHLRPDDYDSNGDIIPTSWEEEKGDLISREALLKAVEEERQYLLANGQTGAEHILVHHCLRIIDSAPTVDTTCPHCDSGYAQGYSDGYLRGKEERPQWNYIKTRPLTEEEKARFKEVFGTDDGWMYDCAMPDDGEQILLLTKWGIELDVADNDYGCGLEDRGDYDGVIAWLYVKDIMPIFRDWGGR